MATVRTTWRVEGMHCPHCQTAIEQAVSSLPGIQKPRASFRNGTLTALWDAQALPLKSLAASLAKLNYTLEDYQRKPLWRRVLSVAGPLAGLVVLYMLLTHTPLGTWLNAFPLARAGMGLGALFTVGLMTSVHCGAMCGGIGIAQSANAAQQGRKPGHASLMYNLGRVVSYTVIGGIVGALGMAFNLSAATKAFIQIAAAAFMLIMALNLLGGFSFLRRLSFSLPRGLEAKIFGKKAGRSSFYVGLANGLMPCGPLQSMQLYALSAGSWWMGALSMLFFSLGTVPLMLGIGFAGGLVQRFAKPMRVFSALLVAALGMSMLLNGMALAGIGPSSAAPVTADGIARIAGEKQVVRTELNYGGYAPITVQSGLPVEWTISVDEKKLNGCNETLYIPAYDLYVTLKPGDNLITFTPEKSSVLPFSCWMGMIRSRISVVDSLDDIKPGDSR